MKGKITREELDQSLITEIDDINEQLVIKAYKTFVTYEEFGAKGDGIYDDGIAIKKAHDYANKYNLQVNTTGSNYYIKTTDNIEIQTPTNWNGAKFYIDDTLDGVNKKKSFVYRNI